MTTGTAAVVFTAQNHCSPRTPGLHTPPHKPQEPLSLPGAFPTPHLPPCPTEGWAATCGTLKSTGGKNEVEEVTPMSSQPPSKSENQRPTRQGQAAGLRDTAEDHKCVEKTRIGSELSRLLLVARRRCKAKHHVLQLWPPGLRWELHSVRV